ncbi:MAG: DNA polymerase III subunit gamma/tau, partial [Alphaproteobacteria bacterium]
PPPAPAPGPSGGGRGPAGAPSGGGAGGPSARMPAAPIGTGSTGGATATALAAEAQSALARYATFDDVLALIGARRDVALLLEVEQGLRLARYRPGQIEFTPTEDAAPDLAQRLAARLQSWTGVRWGVTVVQGATAPTVAERQGARRRALEARAMEHPTVRAVFEAFPKARIAEVRTADEIAAEARAAALPEAAEAGDEGDAAGDDWDPFEEG